MINIFGFGAACRNNRYEDRLQNHTGTRAVANRNHLKSFKINFRIPKVSPIQPTSFGQLLQKLRLEKQLSQRELARLLKVSHDSIRNWERDRFLPNDMNQEKLEKFSLRVFSPATGKYGV